MSQLTVSFDNQKPLLCDVNLKVGKGETFVIVGPSGAGKSVLIKTIAGLVRPSSGKVLIGGEEIHRLSKSDQEKLFRRMGMVFQKNALFDSFTVFENLAFPLRESSDLSDSEIQDRVNWFLEAVGLPHAAQKFPDEISGGMQKRVGVARALILKPEIIFYDDPTAGLDPITSRLIIDLIIRLNKEFKTTVVSITNDMNRAYQMADRMGLLTDRELIVTGGVAETQKHSDRRVQAFIRGEVRIA